MGCGQGSTGFDLTIRQVSPPLPPDALRLGPRMPPVPSSCAAYDWSKPRYTACTSSSSLAGAGFPRSPWRAWYSTARSCSSTSSSSAIWG
jgi:hypothetical protein